MPGTCVIGLQWGDEAKGKIVDILTREHDFVVRYQGGANAGHTVVVGKEVYKLSLLPSGILTPGVTCVIAGGVVLNPARVIEELDELAARGIDARRESADQRPRPRDLPLALCRRSSARQKHVRRREHRHDRPRHWSLLPRQGGPLARRAARRHVSARVPRAGRTHRGSQESHPGRALPVGRVRAARCRKDLPRVCGLRQTPRAVHLRHNRAIALSR